MRRSVTGRVDADGGTAGVVSVGAALGLGAAVQLLVAGRPVPARPAFAAYVVLVAAASTVAYTGLWLHLATGRENRWRVAGWVGVGVLALSLAGGLVVLLESLGGGGVASSAPTAVLVSQALGAVIGLGGGLRECRVVRRAREARAGDGDLAFLNAVLRHHVLNGLQIVDGYASAIADATEGEVASKARAIEHRSGRLSTLVGDVRTLVEAEYRPEAVEPTDAAAALRSAASAVRDAHDATVTVADCPSSVYVRAGPLLETLFEDLLRHAVTGEGAADAVTASVTVGDRVQVRIADDRSNASPALRGILGDGDGYEDIDVRTQTAEGVTLHLVDTLLDRYGGDATVHGDAVVLEFERATAHSPGASRSRGGTSPAR